MTFRAWPFSRRVPAEFIGVVALANADPRTETPDMRLLTPPISEKALVGNAVAKGNAFTAPASGKPSFDGSYGRAMLGSF